jgi:hypothetical protein
MYVYETINLVNGKKYVGVSVKKTKSDNYLGSGVLLKRAIKKYGVDNFKKTILKEFTNEEDARAYEKILINQLNAIEDDNYYNLVAGGYGGGVRKHPVSDETKRKIREKHLGKKLSREQVVNMGKITSQYDLDGNFINQYETKADAEKSTGFSLNKLSGDKIVYIRGFLWMYKKNDVEKKIISYKEIKAGFSKSTSKKNSKLSEKQISQLLQDREHGLTYSELSKKYGINVSSIHGIITGKTYKWLNNGDI